MLSVEGQRLINYSKSPEPRPGPVESRDGRRPNSPSMGSQYDPAEFGRWPTTPKAPMAASGSSRPNTPHGDAASEDYELLSEGSTQPSSAPRRSRGRVLSRFAIVYTFLASAMLGLTGYLTLNSVNFASIDPLSATAGWLVIFGVAGVSAATAVILSVVAVVWCRPRVLAAGALAASFVLPILALVLAANLGTQALTNNAIADFRSNSEVALQALDVLESWNVEVGPLRALLRSFAGDAP